MKKYALCATVFVAAGLFSTSAISADSAAVAAAQSGDKVVFQVSDNDPAKWSLALSNAANARKELGKSLVAEIVAYGPGIDMLKFDSIVADKIQSALDNGVRIVACENTMIGQKLKHDDMLPGIGYVQAGVVEIMRLQQQGYAYIRP